MYGKRITMAKELGVLTFFMTLSCAYVRWDDLVYIIG